MSFKSTRFLTPPVLLVLAVMFAAGSLFYLTAAPAADNGVYCNAVQNRVGFIRYPMGTIAAWSTVSGETADVITRAPRIYPCVNDPVAKAEKDDWRESITGEPSLLSIRYRADKPSGASGAAITVSPHVTVFKITFPEGARKKQLILDFRKVTVDSWARLYKWTERKITRVDDRTLQANLGEPGKNGAYYLIRFSVPCSGLGSIEPPGQVNEDATSASGTNACLFARVNAPSVTVAVAESFTSPQKAAQFLAAEFTDFDGARQNCRTAWNEVLNRVELEGSETSKRMAYTALYTILVNIIDGRDGSHYAGQCSRPLSVASSAYWQFIGGYQSCCWDNIRATYPFLALAYPEVMADVLNTYLARYQLDGCMDGDICLFTGPSGHNNIRFSPVLVAQCYYSGVQADYAKLYSALHTNFHNEAIVSSSLWKLGRLTQPAAGGFACSRSLEYHTGARALALLAQLQHDPEAAREYLWLSRAYTNLWDGTNQAFRLRNADDTWGPIENDKMTWNPNPQGLFEGKTRDWMFAVPHDPYGLIHLPGQRDFVQRVRNYCLNDAWFNDYQEIYPYMLYYADAANEAQSIIRQSWVSLFSEGVMFEGVKPKPPHGGWQTHYTGSSGWLMCSMLGLYPSASPPGQFIIASPSLAKTVVHIGKSEVEIRATNHNAENLYVHSVNLDGKPYPSYMIAAKRLVSGARIELEMGKDSGRRLGGLYLSSSDGFVLNAGLPSDSLLECTIEAAVSDATTKIYSRTAPAKVLVNAQPAKQWSYEPTTKTTTIHSSGTAAIQVHLN